MENGGTAASRPRKGIQRAAYYSRRHSSLLFAVSSNGQCLHSASMISAVAANSWRSVSTNVFFSETTHGSAVQESCATPDPYRCFLLPPGFACGFLCSRRCRVRAGSAVEGLTRNLLCWIYPALPALDLTPVVVGISFPRIYGGASLVLRHLCHEQRIVSSLREGSGAWESGGSLEQQLLSSHVLILVRIP